MRRLQRQHDLFEKVIAEIVERAPDGWSRIEIAVCAVGRLGWVEFYIYVADVPYEGGPRIIFPPSAPKLRDVMYVEGRGTWFTLSLTIRSSGEVSSAFNYEDRPPFDASLAEMISLDLELYPRDSIPQWMIDEQAKVDVTDRADSADMHRLQIDEELAEMLSSYVPAVERERAHALAQSFMPEGPDYRYLRISYSRRGAVDPILRYIELDDLGDEYRRVEVFSSGFMDCADVTFSGPLTSIGYDSLLSLDEVWQEPGVIDVQDIPPKSFQEEWIVVSGVE